MAIKVLSCASALPKKVLTNADLETMVNTSNEWIVKMTGISERRIMADTETFSGYAHEAAMIAIQKAGLNPADIDLIILGTSTPEQLVPSSACIVQGMLGIKKCISFDIQAGCSGFVYALSTAYHFMRSNQEIKHALVLGCDALSKFTDWTDRSTCVLLADGFGAMVLGRNEELEQNGIWYSELGADASGKKHLEVEWGIGQGYPAQATAKPYLVMNGSEVYKSAVNCFTQMITTALEKNHLTLNDIAWFIPHQANVRIIQAIATHLGTDLEKFIITLDKHGNTSAASIPLAFDVAQQAGKIKRGDKIMLTAFGAGYTWGTILLTF